MGVDWRYAIKAVYGSSDDHVGPIHFTKSEYAKRLANSGDFVLLYETGMRPDGSRCIFALGRVTGRHVIELPGKAEGRAFDYAVEWDCQLELPRQYRRAGIPLERIREITGLTMMQSPGGLHRLTPDQFERLADELRTRARSLSTLTNR